MDQNALEGYCSSCGELLQVRVFPGACDVILQTPMAVYSETMETASHGHETSFTPGTHFTGHAYSYGVPTPVGDGIVNYDDPHNATQVARGTAGMLMTPPTSDTIARPQVAQPRPSLSDCDPTRALNQYYVETEQYSAAGELCPITILLQHQYRSRLLVVTLYPPIQFYGYSLQGALTGDTSDLVDHERAAFEAAAPASLPQKMSIILMFPGCPRYSRQVNILRARQTSPTRAQLATVVARELLRFLEGARQGGTPLRDRGHEVLSLRDLVLVEVRHVSKSSLQPIIGVIPR